MAGATTLDTDNPEAGIAEPVEQPAAPDPTAQLQIDQAGEDSDADSTLGTSASSITTSLSSSIRNYVYENGRRYHAFRQGEYFMPNDDAEQDRMDLCHHIWQLCLDGVLFRAPISSKPQNVLDLGTGTGIWAIQFADDYPSAQVVGTDLSPIQPSWVPPNCKFMVDDFESEWAFGSKHPFDYIHARAIGGCVADWPKFYRQAFEHLKPGSWFEMQDYGGRVKSDDDADMKLVPDLKYWQNEMNRASEILGKPLDVLHEHVRWMREAGFVDVTDDVYKVPCGRWPQNPKLKELGMWEREHLLECTEPYTLALFTRILRWSIEECQVIIAKVKNDFRKQGWHGYADFHFVYGRKPSE